MTESLSRSPLGLFDVKLADMALWLLPYQRLSLHSPQNAGTACLRVEMFLESGEPINLGGQNVFRGFCIRGWISENHFELSSPFKGPHIFIGPIAFPPHEESPDWNLISLVVGDIFPCQGGSSISVTIRRPTKTLGASLLCAVVLFLTMGDPITTLGILLLFYGFALFLFKMGCADTLMILRLLFDVKTS